MVNGKYLHNIIVIWHNKIRFFQKIARVFQLVWEIMMGEFGSREREREL